MYSEMFRKALAIFTSIFLLVLMMTNMVLPVYAVNSSGESKKTPIQSGVYCIQSMAVQDMFLGVQDESKEEKKKIQISKKMIQTEF